MSADSATNYSYDTSKLPDMDFKTRCYICGKDFVYFRGKMFYGCPPAFCSECYKEHKGYGNSRS